MHVLRGALSVAAAMSGRAKLLIAALLAASAVMMSAALSTAAVAASPPSSPTPSNATLSPGQPDSNQHSGPALEPRQAGGTASGSSNVAPANAYGCYGSTDYPHPSSHNPGYVNVEGHTWCALWVGWLYAKSDLYRSRWYGWQWLGWGQSSGSGYRVDDNAAAWCGGTGTYTYLGQTYHEASQGGQWMVGYTYNANRFGC